MGDRKPTDDIAGRAAAGLSEKLAAVKSGRQGAGSPAGQKNVYICDSCRYALVTIDRDVGVTPFITKCPKCGARSYSCMYRAPTMLEPEDEWYSPSSDELKGKPPSTVEHCGKGGLIRRKIEGGPNAD